MKSINMSLVLLLSVLLLGCASDSLKAPCPDYGASCDKTPVNSWDTSEI